MFGAGDGRKRGDGGNILSTCSSVLNKREILHFNHERDYLAAVSKLLYHIETQSFNFEFKVGIHVIFTRSQPATVPCFTCASRPILPL